MDTSGHREIYIPKDAQVGSISLWTIPDRVLDRMGVPRPSNNPSSSAPSPSPEGTWISPVLVRKRSHTAASDTDPGGSPFWSMRETLAAAQSSPVEIPFVTSNRVALEVLRDFLPRTQLSNPSRDHPSSRRLPRVSSPPLHQDAVVIYKGNVFLSIRKPKRRRGGDPPPTPPTPASQALSPVSSVSDSPPASIQEPHQTDSPPSHPGELQVPEDSAVPHEDGEEESEDVSDITRTLNPEATSSNLFWDDDHADRSVFVPPHEGRLGTTPNNYEDYDFEGLALDEKIAEVRAKLRESEAALKRGCR
ncbi:unnamed protein product [Lota lota]